MHERLMQDTYWLRYWLERLEPADWDAIAPEHPLDYPRLVQPGRYGVEEP